MFIGLRAHLALLACSAVSVTCLVVCADRQHVREGWTAGQDEHHLVSAQGCGALSDVWGKGACHASARSMPSSSGQG